MTRTVKTPQEISKGIFLAQDHTHIQGNLLELFHLAMTSEDFTKESLDDYFMTFRLVSKALMDLHKIHSCPIVSLSKVS
jgi:hypothetical protein